jgi:hypothetical protein
MFCQAGFDQWLTTIMHHRSPLSKPQAPGLALWRFGMVLARSCALSAVSQLLAQGMPRQEQTGRQQLRDWYYDTPRNQGPKRCASRPALRPCWAGGAGGRGRNWRGPARCGAGPQGASAAGRSRWRGCSCPRVPSTPGAAPGCAWLRLLRPALPQGWPQLVLADRGV